LMNFVLNLTEEITQISLKIYYLTQFSGNFKH
jgi:hypothetical protein